jgi:hypothetical protein
MGVAGGFAFACSLKLIGTAPIMLKTTPAASKTSPIRSMRTNLAVSQIPVANQFDAQLHNLVPHAGAD